MPKGDHKINGLTMTEIELKPYPNNPRFITDDAKEKLGKSMLEFGDLSGIVLNQADGYLISGHQRVNSLQVIEQ
ncbi:MAG: hypothetical protein WC401_02680 [Bacteroidales bacterium]